jgi:hypothetical protein
MGVTRAEEGGWVRSVHGSVIFATPLLLCLWNVLSCLREFHCSPGAGP